MVDEGAVEAHAVARRASDQRDLAEPFLQRVRQQLFVSEQAVDEQEGEAVLPVALGSDLLEPAAQVVSKRHAVGDLEPAQVVEAADRRPCRPPTRSSRPRCCGRGSPAGPISPAVVHPTTCAPPKLVTHLRRQHVAVVRRWSRRRSPASRPAAPRRRGTPLRPRGGPAHTTARCGWSAQPHVRSLLACGARLAPRAGLEPHDTARRDPVDRAPMRARCGRRLAGGRRRGPARVH